LRYNPSLAKEGKNAFVLDSPAPSGDLKEFLYKEVRYESLTRQFREEAERLHAMLITDKNRVFFLLFPSSSFFFLLLLLLLLLLLPSSFFFLSSSSFFFLLLPSSSFSLFFYFEVLVFFDIFSFVYI
jgi:hypothetical protein